MALAISRNIRIGLAFLAGPMSLLALCGVAAAQQDYIDVEAERRAAGTATRPAASTTASSQPQTSSTGAVSYGVGNAPSAVTRTLPPPTPPASDNIGGLFNQVQQLQQEVMRLNGIVEQQAHELRILKEQSLERYLEIDRRLASGATATSPGSTGASAALPMAGSGGSQTTASGAQEVVEQPGEGEAYRAAYALVRGQEFDNALSAFTAFLRRFPDGRYAPNAHYWMGELYLVITPADPEAARQSFMLLLNQYPDNGKIPDALYKLGRVQFVKGNSDGARDFLNRVIREYPQSTAASLARDFIDQNL